MRTDAELVTSTIAGDTSAFAELVARHERSLRATAFYILRDHHAAEDATQDTFVSAYQKLHSLRDRASFAHPSPPPRFPEEHTCEKARPLPGDTFRLRPRSGRIICNLVPPIALDRRTRSKRESLCEYPG